MMQPQPGWYTDPADATRNRYWDGDSWTNQVRPATFDSYASYSAAAVPPMVVPPMMPPPRVVYVQPVPMTADGVPLAGWWWRVLASIIDSVALSLVQMLLLLFMPGVIAAFKNYISAWMKSILVYDTVVDINALIRALIPLTVVSLLIGWLYAFVMLKLVGATLGQLACGLRVVPVDHGQHRGGLPTGSILLRILMYSVLTGIISVGNNIATGNSSSWQGLFTWLYWLVGIYSLLNVLWAAWDKKRQCLHDKVAHTQVVRP